MSSPKLSPAVGAKKTRKRIGRGRGTGIGKTSGRGVKGHGARSGFKRRAWFEGGQMPLVRRVPKGGFTPLRRTEYQVVNLSSLAGAEKGAELTPKELAAKGLIRDPEGLVKILGDGELPHALKIYAHKFSKSAEEKIKQAGGAAVLLAAPYISRKDSGEAKTAGSEN